MRKLILALAAAGALALPVQAQEVTVAITAIVEHPALDAARDGVKAALADAGYKEGEGLKFVYQSAQGNPATAAQISAATEAWSRCSPTNRIRVCRATLWASMSSTRSRGSRRSTGRCRPR